jgi:HPt (histidine-containing phosphotransfer) domain-containing protein
MPLSLAVSSHPSSSGPSSASAVAWPDALDEQALRQLNALDPRGGQQLVGRVLTAYAQSLRNLLTSLPSVPSEADAEPVRHLVHTLKSSSASVGATRMSALCAATERAARAQDHPAWQAEMRGVRLEAERLLASLQQAGHGDGAANAGADAGTGR